MQITMKDGSIVINGKSYTGNNISIVSDKVIVDGKEQGGSLTGPITVSVAGDCAWIELGSGNISIAGRCRGDVKTGSGDVKCGDVGGDVQTGSGDVSCGSVTGSVRTGSGDILRK